AELGQRERAGARARPFADPLRAVVLAATGNPLAGRSFGEAVARGRGVGHLDRVTGALPDHGRGDLVTRLHRGAHHLDAVGGEHLPPREVNQCLALSAESASAALLHRLGAEAVDADPEDYRLQGP